MVGKMQEILQGWRWERIKNKTKRTNRLVKPFPVGSF
jgi:hypothetical protein